MLWLCTTPAIAPRQKGKKNGRNVVVSFQNGEVCATRAYIIIPACTLLRVMYTCLDPPCANAANVLQVKPEPTTALCTSAKFAPTSGVTSHDPCVCAQPPHSTIVRHLGSAETKDLDGGAKALEFELPVTEHALRQQDDVRPIHLLYTCTTRKNQTYTAQAEGNSGSRKAFGLHCTVVYDGGGSGWRHRNRYVCGMRSLYQSALEQDRVLDSTLRRGSHRIWEQHVMYLVTSVASTKRAKILNMGGNRFAECTAFFHILSPTTTLVHRASTSSPTIAISTRGGWHGKPPFKSPVKRYKPYETKSGCMRFDRTGYITQWSSIPKHVSIEIHGM